MSWFGAIFILIACTWIGFKVAQKLTERPRQLRQLKVALQSFEAEIMYGVSPLAEASEKISQQLPSPISHLFKQFSELLKNGERDAEKAWRKSLENIWGLTAMAEEEKEVMLQFGATLGKHEKMQQQKHIRLAMVHLEKEEEEAKDKQNRYEKMAKTLGFLSGLLLIILFL
ncbi:stage III sporulation protein AB [Alteribacillus persepolensis]|uniref:Stage III sporulation protein AB n=1 Tax=Alteribacillus persepolensis TaxID=568899 RepID=A0A1G8CZB3_9BACI|nr:stage III sporulation protein SpoIIIAB [Alteribacillus persepolensis]SDH50836.1 stage III sporulation protein AB [Alteribacillus persepolensis]